LSTRTSLLIPPEDTPEPMLTSIGAETPSTISAEIFITEAEVLVATPPSTEPSEVNAQPLLLAEANISTANAPDSNETDVVPPPLVEVNVPEVQAINPETDLVIVPALPEALVQFTMKYSTNLGEGQKKMGQEV
ncbi:hypothetical protein AMTR_s03847p00004090, partial [Amborella trichopoda]